MANTEANRRWTFNNAGGPRYAVHLRAGALFAAYYVFTTGTVTAVTRLMPGIGRTAEVVALVGAYLTMTILRFCRTGPLGLRPPPQYRRHLQLGRVQTHLIFSRRGACPG